MFCPMCGTLNDEGAEFCGNCGAVMNPEDMPLGEGVSTGVDVEVGSRGEAIADAELAGSLQYDPAPVPDRKPDPESVPENPVSVLPEDRVPQPVAPPPPAAPTNGMAIASLVLGIGGLTVLPLLGSILAILFGYIARREIRENPGVAGDGLALAGIVMGWIAVGLVVLGVLFFGAISVCGICGAFGAAGAGANGW